MNRKRRPSRGNRSPIEITTGIAPRTTASMIFRDGCVIEILDDIDEAASATLEQSASRLASKMEMMHKAADLARRNKSRINRRSTREKPIPAINIGDFVLYAKHKKNTKMDYNTWLGPAVVTDIVSPLVYTIRPYTIYESEVLDVHVSRMRRFAGRNLHMTEQLKNDVQRDFPDNIVGKIVGHEMHEGKLFMMCRWQGFTAELDSAKEATELSISCPEVIRTYYKELLQKDQASTESDTDLTTFMNAHFPSLTQEDEVETKRNTPGAIATGRRKRNRRQGRTMAQIRANEETSTTVNH